MTSTYEHADLRDVKDLPVILQFLDLNPAEKVLDIGCGLGRFSAVITEQGVDYTGIDISQYAIEEAKRDYKSKDQVEFLCMSALDMGYEGYFDKVLCYHVLEHLILVDARILLEKVYRALKPGGTFVLGIPINDFKPYRRLVRLIATGRQWRDSTHQISFSLDDVKREVASTGLCITDVYPLSYSGIGLPEWLSRIPLVGQTILCADIRAIKKDL